MNVKKQLCSSRASEKKLVGESVACIRGVEKELRRDFESVWGKERHQ
jgi:hypothetical protein